MPDLASLSPEERIYVCGQDFLCFFKYYFANYVKSEFAPFHREMADDLRDLTRGTINELAWFGFGESGKTSMAKAYLISMICYGAEEYMNVDSYDGTNSERILFDVALELQTNQRIIQDFGHLFTEDRGDKIKKQKRLSDFVTTNGIRVEAHTTQTSVRGRLHGSKRPGFVLMDDFETKKTLMSPSATETIRTHIQEFKRGLDNEHHRVLFLGNVLSDFGNVQGIIRRQDHDPDLRVRVLPICHGDLETGLHTPTWPERWCLTDEEAEKTGKISIESKRRAMWTEENGDADFCAEMLCRPKLNINDFLEASQTLKNATGTTIRPLYGDRLILGIDTGKNLDYVYGDKRGLLHAGEARTYDDLDKLMTTYPRMTAIIDAGGDQIGSKEFQERWQGRVWRCFLRNGLSAREDPDWNQSDMTVSVHRETFVQLCVDEFKREAIPLNGKREDWINYADDWENLRRIEIRDPVTNALKGHRWVRHGRDHLAAATWFWRVGMSRFSFGSAQFSQLPEDDTTPVSDYVRNGKMASLLELPDITYHELDMV